MCLNRARITEAEEEIEKEDKDYGVDCSGNCGRSRNVPRTSRWRNETIEAEAAERIDSNDARCFAHRDSMPPIVRGRLHLPARPPVNLGRRMVHVNESRLQKTEAPEISR